jgi:hypothetical protein
VLCPEQQTKGVAEGEEVVGEEEKEAEEEEEEEEEEIEGEEKGEEEDKDEKEEEEKKEEDMEKILLSVSLRHWSSSPYPGQQLVLCGHTVRQEVLWGRAGLATNVGCTEERTANTWNMNCSFIQNLNPFAFIITIFILNISLG